MAPEHVLPVVPVQELEQLEPTQDDVVDQEEVSVADLPRVFVLLLTGVREALGTVVTGDWRRVLCP